MTTPVTELDDIQALVRTGYGTLPEASYLLAKVRDAKQARAWLRGFQPTTVAALKGGVAAARHLAISAPGLAALGLAADTVETFSPEYVAGMAGEESRSRRLGDVAANAPRWWAWGQAGQEPHLVVMLYAEAGKLAGVKADILGAAFDAAFEWQEFVTTQRDGFEPFGFADGLSQPAIDWGGEREPGTAADTEYGNLIAPGEVLLGYTNEYGLVTTSPSAPDPEGLLPPSADGRGDLGRNGSYLVFRQLAQDVGGFWRFAEAGGGLPLAEAMVGRRMTGEPLVRTGERPIRGVKESEVAQNGFDFESDGEGLSCPVTGHVRRANPRTGDLPGGAQILLRRLAGMLGFGVDRRADTIASSRFHRVLRRGRKYGESLGRAAATATAGAETGLHFICLGASINRQFEFVQGAWLASAKFGGLTGEQDPLLGSRQPFPEGQATDAFRWPQPDGPCVEYGGLPQFVTVKGGAYFFLPGVRALRFIARD